MLNIEPKIIVKGNENPPRTGAFEITFKDKLLFSKFETNQFPNDNEIMEIVDLVKKS